MAVQTKTQISTELTTNFGDGGAATTAEFRAFMTDIIDSVMLSIAEGNLSLTDFGVTQNFTNDNAGTINKGQPVYVKSNGNVDLADADAAATTTTTIGLVADATIATTASGGVCTFGVVDGFDTSGLTAGALVYVATGTAGGLTTTQPTSGQIKPIGICLESHASTGRVFVCTSGFSAVPLADGASMKDTSGNELLEFGVTASAVNHIKATNQATGSHPSLAAVGGDTNINLDLTPKGSGVVRAGGTQVATVGANVFTGTQDFNAQQVEGFANKVVTSVTGTLTMADHSGNVLVTSGNVTVPTTAGFNAVIIAGGAHTVTFNSTTSAAMATGDVMTVVVESGTVIHAVLTAAADKVSFT